jgi:hypothetical protein
MSYQYDLIKYASHSVIAGLGIGIYDVLIDGRSMTESFTKNDVLTFAVSSVASNFAFDLISSLLPYLNESNTLGMISKHLLLAVIYIMLYDYMIANRYSYYRDNKSNFWVAAGLSVVL